MKFFIPLTCLLMLCSLFKEIVFSAVVPMWHTPDEQAHFAQVAYFSDFGKMPKSGSDLNKEIYEAENLLGTLRDDRGNNKFTYHPEYQIEYTNSYVGKNENEINNFPKEYRRDLVKQESANYPPLYYWISAISYKLFYNSGLITRVFASRMVSVLMGVVMIYFVFLIGKIIFPKHALYQYTLSVLIAFQPMLTFISAGVTSDNLTNLLFTIIIYSGLLVLANGIRRTNIVLFAATFVLLYLTKPQFILALPMFLTAIIIKFSLSGVSLPTKILFTTLFGLVLLILTMNINNPALYHLLEKVYPQSFFPGKTVFSVNPTEFLKISLNRIIHETIPWYWGVFNWLGVVFPIGVIRILNRIMIFAGIGLFVKLIFFLKKRTQEDWYFLYLLLVALIYSLGILFWNYIFFQNHYFSFGLQGRYFFPTIVAHMAILLIGLITLVPRKFKMMAMKLIGISMVLLNFIALWVIAKSYYDISSFNSFIMQASQYKPEIYKGSFLIAWFLLYFSSLIIFIIKYLKLPVKLNEK